jgi:hypothetical protein
LAGALRALHAEKPKDVTLWQHLREIKDPIMAGVVYEDIAATLGAVIAAASIGMTTYTGNPVCSVLFSLHLLLHHHVLTKDYSSAHSYGMVWDR